MEDTYNTSKREKEEDGNEKGIWGDGVGTAAEVS
jgi:hypothetical protein